MRRIRSLRSALAVTAAVALAATLSACAGESGSDSGAPEATATTLPNGFDLGAARSHCREHGGTIQSRQPMTGLDDDPSTWSKLGEPLALCRFDTKDAPDRRSYVDLVTVYSEHPTLAALAYLSDTALPTSEAGTNPARALCSELGGTDRFGFDAHENSGLVNGSDAKDPVVTPCVFADGSLIDEWTLAYHATGTDRGKDLTDVVRFDVDDLPEVYAPRDDG